MDWETLSGQHKGLVRYVARQYLGLCRLDRAADLEDLMQAGQIGLWKAAQTFDPDGGKSWAGWAAWHIQREMRALLGIASARRRVDLGAVSLDAPLSADDSDSDTLMELLSDESLPDSAEALLRAEVRKEVRAAVDRLPDLERAAVEGHRLRGLDYDALAALLNCRAEDVRRAVRRGITALRRDKALRAFSLDQETRFYAHKSVEAFNRDWTSTTEAAALWRIKREGFENADEGRSTETDGSASDCGTV